MRRIVRRNVFLAAQLLLLAFVCLPSMVHAQEPEPQPLPQATPTATPLPAPPPFKMIVKEERAALEGASKDPSRRLKMTIEFADGHLTRAEQHTARENYDAAATEVGMYHALIENALQFLGTFSKRDSNKTRDLYKRLELALRADGPRLTAMRRTTPLEFAVWIKQVEDFAREGRTEALNSFYGHTVEREPPKSDNTKPTALPVPSPKIDRP